MVRRWDWSFAGGPSVPLCGESFLSYLSQLGEPIQKMEKFIPDPECSTNLRTGVLSERLLTLSKLYTISFKKPDRLRRFYLFSFGSGSLGVVL